MSIPLSYNEIDIDGFTAVLKKYQGQPHSKLVADFEALLANKSGARNVLATSSGTAALHLALQVLGIGPGDRVIVPTFAYVAAVNPVRYVGAEPVFVDCERQSWGLDPDLLEQILTGWSSGNFPKAIIMVHNFGVPGDIARIMKLADRFKLWVIEDAAESFGATTEDRWTGTWGHLGTFSFNNNKTITAFGGGALVSDRWEWIDRARFLASQARIPKEFYEFSEVGNNYLMSPLNAAYGMLQVTGMDRLNELRNSTFDRYKEALSNWMEFQGQHTGHMPMHWLPAMLAKKKEWLPLVISVLKEREFEIRRLWNPLHKQLHFSHCVSFSSGVAQDIFERGICFPTGRESTDGINELIENIGVTLSAKRAFN